MAFKFPKITPARVIAFLSLVLNLLGGSGIIPPLTTSKPSPVAPGAAE